MSWVRWLLLFRGGRMSTEAREVMGTLLLAGRAGRHARDVLLALEKESSLVSHVCSAWKGKTTLGQALRSTGAFPSDLCNLVDRHAEPERLAQALGMWLERDSRRRRFFTRLRAAFVIPVIELATAFCIFFCLFGFVFPQLISITQSLAVPPERAPMLYFVWGAWQWVVTGPTALLLCCLVGLVVVLAALRSGGFVVALWKCARQLPVLRGWATSWACVGFARQLGMHLAASEDLAEAFANASSSAGFQPLVDECQILVAALRRGQKISDAQRDCKVLPTLFWLKLDSGLREGAPNRALEEFDDFCETRLAQVTQFIGAIAQPGAVALLAAVVFVVIVGQYEAMQAIVAMTLESM